MPNLTTFASYRGTDAERMEHDGSTRPLLNQGQFFFCNDTGTAWIGNNSAIGGLPLNVHEQTFNGIAVAVSTYFRVGALVMTDTKQLPLQRNIKIIGLSWQFDASPSSGSSLEIMRASSVQATVSIASLQASFDFSLDLNLSKAARWGLKRSSGGSSTIEGFVTAHYINMEFPT